MSQLDCYEVDPYFFCWNWTGRVSSRDGRPIVWRGQRPSSAHRAVYEALIGPIPEGKELDHTCGNGQRCVRPIHMDVVDRAENERRKRFSYRLRIKQCKNGHDLALNGSVTIHKGRVCRICSRSNEP